MAYQIIGWRIKLGSLSWLLGAGGTLNLVSTGRAGVRLNHLVFLYCLDENTKHKNHIGTPTRCRVAPIHGGPAMYMSAARVVASHRYRCSASIARVCTGPFPSTCRPPSRCKLPLQELLHLLGQLGLVLVDRPLPLDDRRAVVRAGTLPDCLRDLWQKQTATQWHGGSGRCTTGGRPGCCTGGAVPFILFR